MEPEKRQDITTDEAIIENHDQAQALADSLWDEMERHHDAITQIEIRLRRLEEKWKVTPRLRRVYVRP